MVEARTPRRAAQTPPLPPGHFWCNRCGEPVQNGARACSECGRVYAETKWNRKQTALALGAVNAAAAAAVFVAVAVAYHNNNLLADSAPQQTVVELRALVDLGTYGLGLFWLAVVSVLAVMSRPN